MVCDQQVYIKHVETKANSTPSVLKNWVRA